MIQDDFIMNAGYNEWAEANSIVVVYPQTEASYLLPYNVRNSLGVVVKSIPPRPNAVA